jgi:hypothetical protein
MSFVLLGTWSAVQANGQVACRSLPRAQDELWLISCRGLGCGDAQQQTSNLQFWRYDRERSWVRADLPELLAGDNPNVITTIFAHGNRISRDEAFTKAWNVYRKLVQCPDERPVRFIAWSWPSEAVRGPINDARVKACRTDPAGYQLGWFVDQLSPDVPVSLWAHSFGARVVTGALHLLGGGAINGHHLAERKHTMRPPMQVALLAAAIDSDWLLPGHGHGKAYSQMAGLLLVNNGGDALLKRYHLIYNRRSCQQALGYTGLSNWHLPSADWAKTNQIEASGHVGRRHILDNYLQSPELVARMRDQLLRAPTEQSKTAGPELAVANDADLRLPSE